MALTVFTPAEVEVGPIGSVMATKVCDPELQAFFREKDKIDRNLSAVMVDDSEAMGVGVGTWEPGQKTAKPIPLMFDEVLLIVSGDFVVDIDGVETHLTAGQVAHLPAKQMVMFSSVSGCRLVWITSPPTWKAIEAAWTAGLIPKPSI